MRLVRRRLVDATIETLTGSHRSKCVRCAKGRKVNAVDVDLLDSTEVRQHRRQHRAGICAHKSTNQAGAYVSRHGDTERGQDRRASLVS